MFRPREEKRWWNVRYLEPYIMILLRSLHGQRATAFYATEKAGALYREGLDKHNSAIVSWMAGRVSYDLGNGTTVVLGPG